MMIAKDSAQGPVMSETCDVGARFAEWATASHEYHLRVLKHLFDRKDIEGKAVMDIGAGYGENTGFFILNFGASRATALDEFEGHGSEKCNFDRIKKLGDILPGMLDVTKKDIWEFDNRGKYGFICAISSLHHIAESKQVLHRNPELESRVVDLFRKIGGWLEDGGKFAIYETARRNWSPIPTYRRRYRDLVDLSTKQDPWAWLAALKKAGFQNLRLRYPSPVVLDRFGFLHGLFNNYLMCILTNSGYVIEASGFKKA